MWPQHVVRAQYMTSLGGECKKTHGDRELDCKRDNRSSFVSKPATVFEERLKDLF